MIRVQDINFRHFATLDPLQKYRKIAVGLIFRPVGTAKERQAASLQERERFKPYLDRANAIIENWSD